MIEYAKGIFSQFTDNPVDWDNEKIISFSQVSKYRTCPKRWELNYIRGHKQPQESIHFVYGTAMHNVIQKWIHEIYTVSVKSANEMDLSTMLIKEMKREYADRLSKNNGVHFSTKEELSEFTKDGILILNELSKRRTEFFQARRMELIGIELPIDIYPVKEKPGVRFTGKLDLVFYDKQTNRYTIIDIKTSTKGWNKWKKKEKTTTDQLVLYKKYFAELFNIDISQIEIIYLIVKRKINEDSMWPQKRISQFSPSNGKVSVNKAHNKVDKFVKDAFTDDAKYVDKDYPALAGKNGWNCKFCEFRDREDLCPSNKRINE